MKTTAEWLSEVKASPTKLNNWLRRQYVGEVLAGDRVADLAKRVPPEKQRVIERIANDEKQHADWVATLLQARDIPIPCMSHERAVFAKSTRYWVAINDRNGVEELLAAGAHAEEMRLHRIRAIVADTELDQDIRDVFSKILPDEEFHAAAFATAAGPAAVEAAAGDHQRGLEALGLTI